MNNIARWDGSNWHPLDGGVSGYVRGIAVSGDDVYVAGFFTRADGGETVNSNARWDGSSWHPLAAGVNGPVFAIAVSGDDVYVGGWFPQCRRSAREPHCPVGWQPVACAGDVSGLVK
ncbi:MAG: hypothetical protein IIA61_06045 [Candidatus Marinimicrobia bacterium]|nr:hypothetical protein [Candidatus Neomarinimicrobiota bacterium]